MEEVPKAGGGEVPAAYTWAQALLGTSLSVLPGGATSSGHHPPLGSPREHLVQGPRRLPRNRGNPAGVLESPMCALGSPSGPAKSPLSQ